MEKKKLIEQAFLDIIKVKKDYPVYADFRTLGISRDTIKYHFSNMLSLIKHMSTGEYSDDVKKAMYSVDRIFDPARSAEKTKKKTLIISTAVAGANAHKGFIGAMRTFAKAKNAQIIIMPCESVTNSFENKTATFDPVFMDKDFLFVQSDTKINDNLSLCSIQVSAKQIKPISGLSRLGHREGSYVFAAPKQFLEYIPSGNSREKNYSIMTPGSCTLPSYYSETYVSKRLSYIAESDHCVGAIIVEVEDEKHFHFRQVQAAADGSFTDMSVVYAENDIIYKVSDASLVLGDLHGAYVDVNAFQATLKGIASKNIKIENVFVHDLFDGRSISHHVVNIGDKARLSASASDDLELELIATASLLHTIQRTLNPEKIYIVKSNHDEVLDRYLSEARYIYDPKNHYLALRIAVAPFEGLDPLKHALSLVDPNLKENWIFLKRGESVKIADFECGSHGDLGMNGGRGSMQTFENVYGSCVIGHNHSAAIHRKVFRVGTLSGMNMGYNRGPSSWTHTSALVYPSGQCQLINVINSKISI